MPDDAFARNGDTPVTRRECSERHEQSLAEAKRAMDKAAEAASEAAGKAAFWVKVSMGGMGVVVAVLLALIGFINAGMASTASSASTAAEAARTADGKADRNEVRLEAMSVLRAEANALLMKRLDSMEVKLDELNKAIRDRNQGGS